jgi:hypothetical protein
VTDALAGLSPNSPRAIAEDDPYAMITLLLFSALSSLLLKTEPPFVVPFKAENLFNQALAVSS